MVERVTLARSALTHLEPEDLNNLHNLTPEVLSALVASLLHKEHNRALLARVSAGETMKVAYRFDAAAQGLVETATHYASGTQTLCGKRATASMANGTGLTSVKQGVTCNVCLNRLK